MRRPTLLATIVAAMAVAESSSLQVEHRAPSGSRAARRLRREGKVPGVVYGGGAEPVAFQVDARTLRHTLAHAHAVLELSIDGGKATPVVVKELSRHPVSGAAVHIDLLRVRLDQPIQATVILDLIGSENAPGVKEGGVLEQVVRELTIEALPGDIPDTVPHDVSEIQIGETVTIAMLTAPRGVKLVDDPETVVATVTPPRLQVEPTEEIEEETEVVGEAPPERKAEAEAEAAGETESPAE
jgi:large subunit ribosomal protein L25